MNACLCFVSISTLTFFDFYTVLKISSANVFSAVFCGLNIFCSVLRTTVFCYHAPLPTHKDRTVPSPSPVGSPSPSPPDWAIPPSQSHRYCTAGFHLMGLLNVSSVVVVVFSLWFFDSWPGRLNNCTIQMPHPIFISFVSSMCGAVLFLCTQKLTKSPQFF